MTLNLMNGLLDIVILLNDDISSEVGLHEKTLISHQIFILYFLSQVSVVDHSVVDHMH